jgi:5S rRNA maturation endonuclease (ribonuclease M5)
VRKSLPYQNLFSAKTLDTIKSGRGSKIIIKNQNSFEAFFTKYFSEDEINLITKSSNIKKLRDSKARKTKSPSIFFIRGFRHIELNGKRFDLAHFTKSFGLFSVQQPKIASDKICFVENLDSFLKAEKLFGDNYIYLHKYGRIGIDSLNMIKAEDVIVFVDYDFNGLDEYLRIRTVYKDAALFIPENFDELFENYSKAIKGMQKQSERVSSSKLNEVVRIRELVSKTSRFLEQEILIHD